MQNSTLVIPMETKVETDVCQCIHSSRDREPLPECPDCNGSGQIEEKRKGADKAIIEAENVKQFIKKKVENILDLKL